MDHQFEFVAEARDDLGKGASRRLRREGKIPAIIYGAGKKPQSITLDHDKVLHATDKEAFYASIIGIKVGKGRAQEVVIKDMQRHVFKPKILHLDFQRIKAGEAIVVNVPLHFTGEDSAAGLKDGGVVSKLQTEVEISCLPKDLPEHIDIDITELELDHTLHLSDITLPEGVSSVALSAEEPNDLAIVTIHQPKVVEEEPEVSEDEAEAAEGETAEQADSAEAADDAAEGDNEGSQEEA